MLLFDEIGWAGVRTKLLLDEGVVPTGTVSNVLAVVPIGGTVATGRV